MPMYLLAYHGGGEPPEGEDAIAVVMDAWNAWMESIADQLVDSGNPVGADRAGCILDVILADQRENVLALRT